MKRIIALFLGTTAVALLLIGAASPNRAQIRKQPKHPPIELSGEKARHYLQETTEGRSLMQAVMAAQFGLKAQEHSPFDEQSGAGYLGMSHDQNLNAWFADDGVTVRPTVSAEEHEQAWQLGFRLKALGYGSELADAPPIVRQTVEGNRIEYHRSHQQSASGNQHLIEWYVNRPEGIEQGFTLNERPARSGEVAANEPLRMSLGVEGELRARVKDEGQEIELMDAGGKGVASYSKLIALDAEGKQLAARMEASADGREIALVVDDRNAAYPLVIDPIVATLETNPPLRGVARAGDLFGYAVAIDGNIAVVGAPREDFSSSSGPDIGYVYLFSRSGSSWSFLTGTTLRTSGESGLCGYSVAISGNSIVYGCPGSNNNTGTAYKIIAGADQVTELIPRPDYQSAGNFYGASVAISGNNIVVGTPEYDEINRQNTGVVTLFRTDSSGNITDRNTLGSGTSASQAFGTGVAIDSNTIVVGAPSAAVSYVNVYTLDSGGLPQSVVTLQPGSGTAGDRFGAFVAVSGNTIVVSASADDDRGENAGAAYVFVRNGTTWSEQQKLTGSDTSAGDRFGFLAAAIQGNTIVVGAYGQDGFSSSPDPDRGAAYIFTRSGTFWTQETRLSGGAAGDGFGCAVDIDENTVIVGATGVDISGQADAGAAYVYRLDCVPPYGSQAFVIDGATNITMTSYAACPGTFVRLVVGNSGSQRATRWQWRKNGVNIPSATANYYDISSASASDASSYDAFVSNSCGGEFSTPATLTVHSFSLNPTNGNFGVAGSAGIVNVTSSGSCDWTAVSNAPWIRIDSGTPGTGPGPSTVGFTVFENPNSGQRTGTMTIAGLTFAVSQDGTNCSYSLAPASQSLAASASTNTVNVSATAGCDWTATSNDSFISVNAGASGTGNGTVTYTVAANFTATQRTGTLTIAGQGFTVTQAAAATLANVSTRLPVGTGDNVLIEGFIVQGPIGSTKKIMVRAIGPSLAPFGIPDALENPILEIRDANNTAVATNDDWRNTQVGGIITSDQSGEISGSGLAPGNDLESAVIANLNPGSYTAVVRGVGNTVGTGVVDAYDLSAASPARLANIATRGLIQPGDKLMIAGFIIQNGEVRAVVRAIGPSLSAFGITNALSDTTLQIRDQNGTVVRENDDWESDPQKQQLIDVGLQPSDSREAAVVAILPPGQYTVQVRGKPETTGIGVVQVYFLQ